MHTYIDDDKRCGILISLLAKSLPNLIIKGGADEPFYQAPKGDTKAIIYFRSNYPRSLLHELSHYCLAGERRRKLDDFGYWYSPCGRTADEQSLFEKVEARPPGLEKAMCEAIGSDFSPILDDFSGRSASKAFLNKLEESYNEMRITPPPTAKKVLVALSSFNNYAQKI